MSPFIDLALAALDQVASARRRREFVARAWLIAAGALLLATAAGFLIAASYIALADSYGRGTAAALVGAGLAILGSALIFVRRRAVRIVSIAPAAVVPLAVAPGRGGPQVIFGEFNRILESNGPLAAAFFFVGLSAGLVSRWVLVRRG